MKTKRLFALVMAVLLLVFTMFGCADTSTFRDDDDDDDDRPSANKPNNSQTSQIQAGKVADELDVDAATELPDAVVPDPYFWSGKMIGSGEPKEIEALIAVDMSKILSAGNTDQGGESGSSSGIVGSDGVYVPEHSKLDCLTCRGSGDCTSCGGSGKR